MSETLRAFARGSDRRPWEPQAVRRSVGAQASWGVRFNRPEEVEHFVRQLCAEVDTQALALALARPLTLTLTLTLALALTPTLTLTLTVTLTRALTLTLPQSLALSRSQSS